MRSRYMKVGLLCLVIAVMSMMSASAAMAVKISPAGNTIQLKATNIKLHMWGEESEVSTCELWQTSGKINSLGTLPVNLEAPSFGKGAGECTVVYSGLHLKARVIKAGTERLEASSKTAASLYNGWTVIQLETSGGKLIEGCKLELSEGATYNGVWANGTSKEKPSTLTLAKAETGVVSPEKCSWWGNWSGKATLSATFNVTDTTEPNSLVMLE